MQEAPQQRWAFIRKVYSILTVQILATIAANPQLANFFRTTWGGWATYLAILIATMAVTFLLYIYEDNHPVNFLVLALFTVCFGLLVGLVASFGSPKIIIEAATATVAVVVALTAYTFWEAKMGEDFGFVTPFVLSSGVTLAVSSVYTIFFPMGEVMYTLCNILFMLVFSLNIIYNTNALIKRNAYDEYIGYDLLGRSQHLLHIGPDLHSC